VVFTGVSAFPVCKYNPRFFLTADRVIKPGGDDARHPSFAISRFFADIWMLFPTEQEYLDWFTKVPPPSHKP
jgi:hypothetical protein